MNQRNGTDVDAGNVCKVFTKLGYAVKIYNDQTTDQMMTILSASKYKIKRVFSDLRTSLLRMLRCCGKTFVL